MQRSRPWLRSGGTSDATKVVFDAARRSGVSLPSPLRGGGGGDAASGSGGGKARSASAREYARHLLKLQVSSRHQRSKSPGGRSGGPSAISKVIAAATRPKSPSGPMLAVPTAPRRKDSPRAATRLTAMRPDEQKAAGLIGGVPKRAESPSVKTPPTTLSKPSAATTATPPKEQQQHQEPAPPIADAAPMTQQGAPDLSAFVSKPVFEEDDMPAPAATMSTAADTTAKTATAAKPLDFGKHTPKKREVAPETTAASTSSFVTRPSASAVARAAADPAAVESSAPDPEAAASVWAELRAQELAAQEKQEAVARQQQEEAARAAAVLEQQEQWLTTRPQPDFKTADPEVHAALYTVYTAQSWDRAFAAFSRAVAQGKLSKGQTIQCATAIAPTKCPPEAAQAALTRLQALVEGDGRAASSSSSPPTALSSSASATWRALRLRLMNRLPDDGFATEFKALTPEEVSRLPAGLIIRGIHTQCRADWAAGCHAVARLAPLVHDPFGNLDLAALKGFPRTRENRGTLFELTHSVEQRLRAKLSEIGKSHLTELMRAYGRSGRHVEVKRLFNEASQRGEMDETIAATYLRYSLPSHIKTMIPELKAMQLNVYSPRVTTNAMLACLMKRDVDAAFEVYDEFRSRAPADARNAWTPGLVNSLASAMRALPKISERMVDELETGVRAEYGSSSQPVPSHLARVLISGYIDTGRFEQAVETFDAMEERAKTRFSPEGGARVNTALHAVGRDPVEFEVFEDASESTDGAAKGSRFVASAKEHKAEQAAAEAAASTVDLPQAEELLELAKQRDWEGAVEVLEGIDDSTLAAASAKQATLLFNCALSAAVEVPEAIDKILARMNERNVSRNTTTYNTAMSALARDAGRWSESIAMYQLVPKAERDSSTYSVAFSVFGKRGLWEEATDVFTETRASKIKLTPAQYSLVVQATHKSAWATSLAAFCDLRKHHGAENIKELVVNRVAKSLEAHGRDADVPRLHEAMKAKGKAAGGGGGGKKKKGA